MAKKTLVAYFRGKPEYIDLLVKLYASGKYNLIVNAEIAQALAARNIPFDVLENYFVAFTEESHADVKHRLHKLFGMHTFQKKFSYDSKSFFKETRQELLKNLTDQFSQSINLIDGFNNLFKQQRVDLVMVWTDVIRNPKALTATAQSNNIPVLQLLHGGFTSYLVGHYENKIYADKIANLSANSKEIFSFYQQDINKIVETGMMEFDYISDPPVSRNAACSLLGLNAGHPIIVFGTSWTHPYSAWFKELQENLDFTNNTFIAAFAQLKEKHPDLQLLIKVHPSFQEPFSPTYFKELAKSAGIDDAIITTEHLQGALIACDLLVSFKSTICIDALLLGKPVVILDFETTSDYLFFENYGLDYVRIPGDTYAAISRALFDDKFKVEQEQKRKKAKYFFNYLNDGKTAERIIDLISEMAGG